MNAVVKKRTTKTLLIFGDKLGHGTQSIVVCNKHLTYFDGSEGDLSAYDADSDASCDLCEAAGFVAE